jgi:hypothetical protein
MTVPGFETVEEAENFLADMSRRAGTGEFELQSAIDVSTLVRNWIISRNDRTELELKIAAHHGEPDKTIRISDGLPPLPGCDISCPKSTATSSPRKSPNKAMHDITPRLNPPNPSRPRHLTHDFQLECNSQSKSVGRVSQKVSADGSLSGRPPPHP